MNSCEDPLLGAATAVVDAEGRVTGWTGAAQRLLGYPAREVVGRPAAALLASAEAAADAPAVLERLRARGGWCGSLKARHRDGHRVPLQVWVDRLSAPQDRTVWLVVAADTSVVTPLTPPAWSASTLGSLLSRIPLRVLVWDLELHRVWRNDLAERDGGVPPEQCLVRRTAGSQAQTVTESLETVLREVARSGVPVVDAEYRRPTSADPGRERVFAASVLRLDRADGSPLGLCMVSVDVTDSRRAHQRLALVGDAGARIGTTLDVMRTAQELAEFVVPRLADYCTVDLAESVRLGEEPLARVGPDAGRIAVFHRAGVASVRAGVPESLWEPGTPVFVPRFSPFTEVLITGRSYLEPVLDTSRGSWLDADPARAAVIRETGMHSLMMVAIHARGTVLGIAVLVRTVNQVPFEQDDLVLAEELVGRAALSLDNARRYTRERTTALALQRHLLPQRLTGGSAVEVASHYLPADVDDGVGGDWYDVIPLSGARVALVLGDVVGHGINAAATMGRLRAVVRTLADLELPPDELLARLDGLVAHLGQEEARSGDGRELTLGLGATCLYAVYDPVTRSLEAARAGHPPPVIVDPSGAATFAQIPVGSPLGLGLLRFDRAELPLAEGSVIALYSDGLVERRDRDIDAGMGRLAAVLGHPSLPLEELCSTAVAALATGEQSDDVTLLLARTRALDEERVATWELPADARSARAARRLAAERLAAWGLPQRVGTTEQIVSELVANAVRFGAAPVRLRLIHDESLVCEVFDAGDGGPRLRHAGPADESGRGLLLVSRLARRWGTRTVRGGKLVWAEQELAPAL